MRPTDMRTVGILLAAVALAAAGCGPQGAGSDGATDEAVAGSSTSPAAWGACTIGAFGATQSRQVGQLDGGGEAPVPVRLVESSSGPCAGGLVARTGRGLVGVDVAGLGLEPGTARVVTLKDPAPGEAAELLLVHGGSHPRGGYQPHLFVLSDGLHEVRVDGHPLLPFVATDGGGTPATARCGDHGTVEVLAATTSEPPGVILAWDVRRTTYRLHGGEAELLGTAQIRDHAADPVLRKELPQLFEPDRLLADCRR
jgi:hypothetical protein